MCMSSPLTMPELRGGHQLCPIDLAWGYVKFWALSELGLVLWLTCLALDFMTSFSIVSILSMWTSLIDWMME
jgi:hypothetical protein